MIVGLDQIKRGRGPVVVKTVAGTVFVVLLTSLYGVVKIKRSGVDAVGILSPTDQILMFKHLLEVTLMGMLVTLVLGICDVLVHLVLKFDCFDGFGNDMDDRECNFESKDINLEVKIVVFSGSC